MEYKKVDDRHFFYLSKSADVVVLTETQKGLILSTGERHAESDEVVNIETMITNLKTIQEKQV